MAMKDSATCDEHTSDIETEADEYRSAACLEFLIRILDCELHSLLKFIV